MRYTIIILAAIIGIIPCSIQFAHAEHYRSVFIPPYDEKNLRTINQSMSQAFSKLDNFRNSMNVYMDAVAAYKIDPTELNKATVIEQKGKVIETGMEFISNAEMSLGKAIPELQKYKRHLHGIIEIKTPDTEKNRKKIEKTIKRIETFSTYMDKVYMALRETGKNFALRAKGFVEETQIGKELDVILGGVNGQGYIKGMAKVLDMLTEMQNIFDEGLFDGLLSTADEDTYEEDIEIIEKSLENYYKNSR